LSDFIKFLGTAGARYVVTRQMRSSAGLWCSLNGLNMLIDPGPGTLARCFSVNPELEPDKLDAIILTHRHIDHSTDLNIMVEAMTGGALYHKGLVLLPGDALLDEPVLYRYLREIAGQVIVLKEGQSYQLGKEVLLTTPVKHEHSVETYGVKLQTPQINLSLIADTNPFHGIADYYMGEILILNVVLYKPAKHKWVQHLDLESACKIIKEVNPQLAVLTHFGHTMLKNCPWQISQRLTRELGIEIVAAYDGYQIDLSRFYSKN